MLPLYILLYLQQLYYDNVIMWLIYFITVLHAYMLYIVYMGLPLSIVKFSVEIV